MSETPMFELSWKKKMYGDKLSIVIIQLHQLNMVIFHSRKKSWLAKNRHLLKGERQKILFRNMTLNK
jgi:hypothetical protein